MTIAEKKAEDAAEETASLPPLPTPDEEVEHIKEEGEPFGGNFA